MKQLLYFLAGTAAGLFTGFVVTKNHYESIIDEEIESVKEAYREEKETVKSVEDVKEKIEADYISHSSLEDMGYAVVDVNLDPVKNDFPREEREQEPYVITYEDYAGEHLGFDKQFVIYWAGNGILTTEDGSEELDIDQFIGRECLTRFGEDEVNTAFVRNEMLSTDYEIFYNENTYLGMEEEEET